MLFAIGIAAVDVHQISLLEVSQSPMFLALLSLSCTVRASPNLMGIDISHSCLTEAKAVSTP